MNRKTLLIVLTIAVAMVASACGSTSPKIAMTTPPPASLEINNSASIAATTTHDKGEGVDWSCSPSPCGSFNPAHTASGATTVYTAPSTAAAVTITAASTKKSTVTATASVTINPVATASSLSGQYAFFAAGADAAGDAYNAVGSVTLVLTAMAMSPPVKKISTTPMVRSFPMTPSPEPTPSAPMGKEL